MIITRQEIQTELDIIIKDNPDGDLYYIKSQLSKWLDEFDLSEDNLTHDFIKDHILDDLNSYQGVNYG